MVALLEQKRETGMRLAQSDRRLFPRTESRLHVQGFRLDHTVEARQHPHLSLDLCDISLGGIGALSDMPLHKGEQVTISFPQTSRGMGWDAYGRVIRCQPSGTGYRVAVEFNPLPAA